MVIRKSRYPDKMKNKTIKKREYHPPKSELNNKRNYKQRSQIKDSQR